MKVSIKETVVRWHSVEIDDDSDLAKDLAELEGSCFEDMARDPLFEDIAENGWDGESVLELSIYKGDVDDG